MDHTLLPLCKPCGAKWSVVRFWWQRPFLPNVLPDVLSSLNEDALQLGSHSQLVQCGFIELAILAREGNVVDLLPACVSSY